MTNQLIDISRTKTPEKQLERRIQEIISSYTDFQETSQMAKLTGLRRSDIDRLTWGNVHEQGEFTRLIFRQKKTKGREYLGIAGEARALMGVRGNPDGHPFTRLMTPTTTNRTVQEWVSRSATSFCFSVC